MKQDGVRRAAGPRSALSSGALQRPQHRGRQRVTFLTRQDHFKRAHDESAFSITVMSLLCSGLSHHTAPVAVRERLSFPPHEARGLISSAWLREATERAGLAELTLLSTCNRTELYAVAGSRDGDPAALTALFVMLLARAGGVAAGTLAPHVYLHADTAAVEHLCRVAAGLDSMIVGETEILGQVGIALGIGMEAGTSGPMLDAMFHSALRAGRRARAETAISRRPASVSGEAVQVLRDRLSTHPRPSVLVLGTGTMGRSVSRILHDADFATLQVAGRTPGRAREVAAEFGGECIGWNAVEDSLTGVDAVVAATGSPEPVITAEMVLRARGERSAGRSQLFVDIAVPRNVDPSVRSIAGVDLLDLDHLQARIAGNIEERRAEIPLVERIIAEEIAYFQRWRRGSESRPVLAALRAQSERIRQRTVTEHLSRLGDVDSSVRERVEALSRDLVTQLLHEPSRRMRTETDPTRARATSELVRDLFGLVLSDDEGGPPSR